MGDFNYENINWKHLNPQGGKKNRYKFLECVRKTVPTCHWALKSEEHIPHQFIFKNDNQVKENIRCITPAWKEQSCGAGIVLHDKRRNNNEISEENITYGTEKSDEYNKRKHCKHPRPKLFNV